MVFSAMRHCVLVLVATVMSHTVPRSVSRGVSAMIGMPTSIVLLFLFTAMLFATVPILLFIITILVVVILAFGVNRGTVRD